MKKEKIISRLGKMDLSNYEARAYLAVLSQPPIAGYKLSELSGVTRSGIYETNEKLISKGLLVFQSGKKNFITPLDFKTFLNRIERENSESIKYFREKKKHAAVNFCLLDIDIFVKRRNQFEKIFLGLH